MTQHLEITTEGVREALSGLTGKTGRLEIDPETVEQDLARLVLGLIAFLRQLMELQAIRQIENDSLTEQQQEQLGTTLMRAEEAIHNVAGQFNLTPEDLSLDLGPLGKTI
ncbi:gas vesicle protein K [Cognatiyoonia sp. IB215446]|uniref:gas vesicle protein K n=1 Tax=Cognatiyoonia sp. IB215446 TaxID=3097355 RepID=UPI002A0ACA73|nr:gas vesicle protein K [Cognatiyoonia sp. IB215446]MDX8348464.1 gas vesicle protein K [Cognatiyoonia sp. IB215446]